MRSPEEEEEEIYLDIYINMYIYYTWKEKAIVCLAACHLLVSIFFKYLHSLSRQTWQPIGKK
jgi:hypothetical protein